MPTTPVTNPPACVVAGITLFVVDGVDVGFWKESNMRLCMANDRTVPMYECPGCLWLWMEFEAVWQFILTCAWLGRRD